MLFSVIWRAVVGGQLLLAATAGAVPPPRGSPPAPTVQQRLRQANRLLDASPELALRVAEQVLAQARQQHDARRQLACLNVMATAAAFANDPAGALRYDYQRLALARQLGDSATAAHTCNNLASTLIDQRDTAQAAAVLRQGLGLVPHGLAGRAARGTLLNSVATMRFNEGNYEQTIFQARQALRLLGPRPDSASRWVVSSLQGVLAASYASLGQPERAEQMLSETLAQDRQRHDSRQVAQNLIVLASSLLSRDEPAGLDTLRAALGLARRLDAPQRALECYEEFRTYYSRLGQYELAYAWSQRERQLSDSLNNHQHHQALVAANTYYAAEAREHQIAVLHERARLQHAAAELLRTRNQLLLSAVAVLALALAGAAWFGLRLRRQDQLLAHQNAALAQATAEAQRYAAAQDRLYALVAHDLRGPVASFAGVSQLIELYLEQQDGAGLAQLNTLVRQTARNLSELLHNLLGWSLTQTGELSFAPQLLPVAPLLAEVTNLYHTTAQARRVRLVAEPPPVGLRAWADANMLPTILRNLVGNALRYAPEGGLVTLRAAAAPTTAATDDEPAGGGIVLTVTDNGSGMSAEQIWAVLGAHADGLPLLPHRADPRAGTGLGLTLCLAFVRRHGGQLDIQSEPGHGTCVRVRLPLPSEPAASVPTNAALSDAQ